MILVILFIFLAIWGWKKYATSQSNEGTLYSYYPKLGYYWVALIVMAGFEMYAAYQAWTKGFEFATHDWANDLSGLFGLDYLYSLYKDSSAYSDYMSSLSSRASEITGPLLTAWLLTSLINIIVIGTIIYCWINLPKGKVSKEKTLKLGLIAGIAVIVTYMWLSYAGTVVQNNFGYGKSQSPMLAAIIEMIIPTIIVYITYRKHKTVVEEVFEQSEESNSEAPEQKESTTTAAQEATKECPYCGETILAVAKKCKHCGEWLPEEKIIATPIIIECPICGEDIEEGTEICPHCKERLIP